MSGLGLAVSTDNGKLWVLKAEKLRLGKLKRHQPKTW